MKTFKIIYWVSTGIIALLIGLGSFADLLIIDAMKDSIQQQGFPVHFLPFFGVAKLLATIVILVPALKYFKLSAYVGLFWYFLGAIYSHIMVGDDIATTSGAIFALVAVLASYFAWRKISTQTT